jgi:hypothetical protein
VAWLYGNDVVQRLGDNAYLYDLSKIRGVSAIINRIPDDMSGVYAWYRNFDIDTAAHDDPEAFVSNILQELCKPHCVTRKTSFPPSHRLIVKPDTKFSSRKQKALKYYATNPDFRELIITLLHNCLLFQQPLYIGKAINIKTRISNHLKIDSKLRERLEKSKHNLEQCRLLILGCSENLNSHTLENVELEDENENEISHLESEALIEDILSRLFLPLFTIKYG